jgi:hypothetical protein
VFLTTFSFFTYLSLQPIKPTLVMREKLHLFCAAAAAVLAIGTAQASQQAFTRVTPSTVNHSTALRSALK